MDTIYMIAVVTSRNDSVLLVAVDRYGLQYTITEFISRNTMKTEYWKIVKMIEGRE